MTEIDRIRDGLEDFLIENQYTPGNFIGSGTCSTVYKGTDNVKDRPVAIVVMWRRESHADMDLLEKIKGMKIPFIAHLYDILYYQDIVILIEQLAAHTASKIMGPISAMVVVNTMNKFKGASDYLANRRYLRHEDPHLRNVGFFEQDGKLVAKYFDLESLQCYMYLRDVDLEGVEPISPRNECSEDEE